MKQTQLFLLAAVIGLGLGCGGGSGDNEPADQSGQDQDTVASDQTGQDIPGNQDVTKPQDVVDDTTPPTDTVDAEPLPDEVEPDEDEQDVDTVCTPDCTGKLCGPDGCGSTCGSCESGYSCDPGTFTCVEAPEGVATFFDSMYLPHGSDTPCCFDYTGDGEVDNGVGGLLDAISSLMQDSDVNQMLADAIAQGKVAILLEFVGVADWTTASGFTMNAYLGTDADADYTNNLDPVNGGEFLILPSSLDDMGNPLIAFEGASIDNGVLTGGPAQFIVSVPLLDATPITLVLDEALIEGDITAEGGTKLHIDNGKLGGVIQKKVIVEGLNAYVATTCECLGLTGDLINLDAQECATNGTPESCIEDNACGSIYNYCSIALGLFDSILDVDLDDDGANDSVSVGIQFTSIPAQIVGTATTL